MIFFINGIFIGMVGLLIKNATPYPDILYIKCPKASFYFWAFYISGTAFLSKATFQR